jgi:hypothetical protein
MIDIEDYGIFKSGLTSEEIKEYLNARWNWRIAQGYKKPEFKSFNALYKKFYDIAGVNTCQVVKCPNCNESLTLMYRHDILRFANVLFGVTKDTYFD